MRAATLLRELDVLIDGDRYFLSPPVKTLRAIRAKLRPEPVRDSGNWVDWSLDHHSRLVLLQRWLEKEPKPRSS